VTIQDPQHLDLMPQHEVHPAKGYETSDLSVRAIVKFGIGFAIFITAAHLVMLTMFTVFQHDDKKAGDAPVAGPRVAVSMPPIGPQLEVSPSANWQEMHAAEQRILGLPPYSEESGYAWVHPDKGVARIPINRAKELALQRGFPVRAGATTQPTH
jgi:hypothetical protein